MSSEKVGLAAARRHLARMPLSSLNGASTASGRRQWNWDDTTPTSWSLGFFIDLFAELRASLSPWSSSSTKHTRNVQRSGVILVASLSVLFYAVFAFVVMVVEPCVAMYARYALIRRTRYYEQLYKMRMAAEDAHADAGEATRAHSVESTFRGFMNERTRRRKSSLPSSSPVDVVGQLDPVKLARLYAEFCVKMEQSQKSTASKSGTLDARVFTDWFKIQQSASGKLNKLRSRHSSIYKY